MTETRLRQFLSKKTSNRCSVCDHSEVAAIIEEHLDLLSSGETQVSLSRVYNGLLFPEFQHPKCMDTVRSHVRKCLKRDPKTGGSL